MKHPAKVYIESITLFTTRNFNSVWFAVKIIQNKPKKFHGRHIIIYRTRLFHVFQ